MIEINRVGGVEYMSLDTFARWMCFVEALFFIEKHAEDMGIDEYDLVKPAAIEKYIEERYNAMRYDVGVEYENGTI